MLPPWLRFPLSLRFRCNDLREREPQLRTIVEEEFGILGDVFRRLPQLL